MITAAQIRAGRALLNVKQSELAKAAGVSLATLNNIERGVGDPRSSTLQAIERALKAAGIEVDEDGIHETVTLVKYARPNALDTYFGSQRVLECLSPKASKLVTENIKIPTIGIGSSLYCDGQILVTDDMLGISGFYPKFVKKYAYLDRVIEKAVKKYTREVKKMKFPSKKNFF